VDPLTTLGGIVLVGSEEDIKAILQLIEELERLGRESEVGVALVPLEKGDATEIVSVLNQLFSRVPVLASGGGALEAPRTGGIGAAAQGQAGSVQGTNVALLAIPRFNSILV